MDIEQKVREINAVIMQHPWYDIELSELKGNNLLIIGSDDFSYYHTLELIFENVCHVSLNMEWKSDTSKPILELVKGKEATHFNLQYQVEQGNILFKFFPEDFNDSVSFYIAAKNLNFNTDKVYYYKKVELGKNERIASWVE